MNKWKCVESCMGSGLSCEIKLVHDNTPNKCITNGKPVLWKLQNVSSNKKYTAPQATPKSFSVSMISAVDNLNGGYQHPTYKATMYINKNGVNITLDPDEIRQVVQTAGGNFKR